MLQTGCKMVITEIAVSEKKCAGNVFALCYKMKVIPGRGFTGML